MTAAILRPKSQLRRLIKRHGLRCHWCHRICSLSVPITDDAYPTREHLVRTADGGSNRMTNQVIACRRCNNTRHQTGWKPHAH